MSMEAITAIFFDAGGTLFEARQTIGAIYSGIALRYGVAIDSGILDTTFHKEFVARSSQGFPKGASDPLVQRQWWFELVRKVLADRFPKELICSYFSELYGFFGGAGAWRLYPEALECLKRLREQGFRLGVVSNFDSRLRQILQNLGIGDLFEQVALSWEAGAAKPRAKIFKHALKAMGLTPRQVLHVGDSIAEDVEGARGAGLTPVLLDRLGAHCQWKDSLRIRSLAELSMRVPSDWQPACGIL